MRSVRPREITREQANVILEEGMKGPKQIATICYRGKWWDVRGVDSKSLQKFIKKILTKI